MIAGELPLRVHRLVVKWAETHQSELHANWRRARNHLPLIQIEPLR